MPGVESFTGRGANHLTVKRMDVTITRPMVCLRLQVEGFKKLLTTGPDLPVMPAGPGAPLIASCGSDRNNP